MTGRSQSTAAERATPASRHRGLFATLSRPFMFGLVAGLIGCAMLWSAPMAGARERLATQLGVQLGSEPNADVDVAPADAIWQPLLLLPQLEKRIERTASAEAWSNWEARLRQRTNHAAAGPLKPVIR
jgi:hypothetical protein